LPWILFKRKLNVFGFTAGMEEGKALTLRNVEGVLKA
jgi:hypothetical protein